MIARGCAVLVIGASGTGKSTLGRRLAEVLSVPFLEGDDFHPAANIRKMSAGHPLDDTDRWPWLDAIGAAVTARRSSAGIVVTCSALKRSYRDRLRSEITPPLLFACLMADRDTLLTRLQSRPDHFMPASLLDSQLAAFEIPDPDERAAFLDAEAPLETLVATLINPKPDG